jgi:RNA polymerase sigma factor (sigma-70 family)
VSSLEKLLLDNLPVVESTVRRVAFRHHLAPEERDELASLVHLHLIEDNYAVLRKFAGRSTLQTYLTTVVTRVMLDERTRRRGKWRPSAHARRMGPEGRELERLRDRDGHTPEEAASILASRSSGRVSVSEARALCDRLPPRMPRATGRDVELETLPNAGPDPFKLTAGHEAVPARERAFALLRESLEGLEPTDALVLRMRYEDGLTIAQIARALALPPKPLYRRLESLREELRRTLEAAGVSADRVHDFLAAPEEEEPPALAVAGENVRRGPSTSVTGESERTSHGRIGEEP